MFFSLYRHFDDGVFDDFPKIFDHFRKSPKLVRRSLERCRTFSENFWRLRRLSRETRRCFEHTPTNLKETNLISVKPSVSSLVRIWKMRHSSLGCSFVWILPVVYFLVEHSCLYICLSQRYLKTLAFLLQTFTENKHLILSLQRFVEIGHNVTTEA